MATVSAAAVDHFNDLEITRIFCLLKCGRSCARLFIAAEPMLFVLIFNGGTIKNDVQETVNKGVSVGETRHCQPVDWRPKRSKSVIGARTADCLHARRI
jgi:hypothetical protein